MKKNNIFFVLAIFCSAVSFDSMAMFARLRGRVVGGATTKMAPQVSSTRFYSGGRGMSGWMNQIAESVRNTWRRFWSTTAPQAKESFKKVSEPIAVPVAMRLGKYVQTYNESKAITNILPLLRNNNEFGIIESFMDDGRPNEIKGHGEFIDFVKGVNAGKAIIPRYSRFEPSGELIKEINAKLSNGHTLYGLFLINFLTSAQKGVDNIYNAYQADQSKKDIFVNYFRIVNNLNSISDECDNFIKMGAELNSKDVSRLKTFFIDIIQQLSKNFGEILIKDARILASFVFLLRSNRIAENIFDKSAELDDYIITSTDGTVYKINKKNMDTLLDYPDADILVKKVKDLGAMLTKSEPLSSMDEKIESIARAIRDLVSVDGIKIFSPVKTYPVPRPGPDTKEYYYWFDEESGVWRKSKNWDITKE